jgi:ABC-type phosphate/phosphonate transport system substrate-binding protein
MPADERERLTRALLDAHRTPSLAPVLEDLLLRRFERVREQDYAVLLEQRRAAEAADYPRLA